MSSVYRYALDVKHVILRVTYLILSNRKKESIILLTFVATLQLTENNIHRTFECSMEKE